MLIPLSWLSEYVILPKKTKDLTDRLTSVGHMLDKIKKVGSDTVIDLELRGNRSDMFSVYGTARDVAAAFKQPLKSLELSPLPSKDPNHSLIQVEPSVKDILHRYTALSLSVKVADSPDWLKQKLSYFDIPSINNVVDITNLVTLELGQTLHAFDIAKIKNRKLILRTAKKGELFHTVQQGLDVLLNPQDFVAADSEIPQCLSLIGGLHSKVTEETQEILLESAVYDPTNCRQSARRLKIFTYGGNLHEKLLDPNQVEVALQRAVFLLQKYADAKITSSLSDYFPKPNLPLKIPFDFNLTEKIGGIQIPENQQISYLESLGFVIQKNIVTVPTFRTDITQSADLVEEILRLHGYDQIPQNPLPGLSQPISNFSETTFINKLNSFLINLDLDEVITLPLISEENIENKDMAIYPQNPPDPTKNILRPSLIPSLLEYAKRQLNQQTPRVAIFELGHVFSISNKNYLEQLNLGIVIAGNNLPQNWQTPIHKLSIYDLKGLIDKLCKTFKINNPPLVQEVLPNIFAWEINLNSLINQNINPVPDYQLISIYPPIIEDFNINLTTDYKTLEENIKKISSLINQIDLIDKYDNKLTLRITFHDLSRQLSKEDISPIREQINNLH